MLSYNVIYNLIGFAGDFITLLAYFLLQTNKIKSNQLSYGIYNLIGSIFLLISLYYKPNSPAIIIEISWSIISIYGIYKFFSAKINNTPR